MALVSACGISFYPLASFRGMHRWTSWLLVLLLALRGLLGDAMAMELMQIPPATITHAGHNAHGADAHVTAPSQTLDTHCITAADDHTANSDDSHCSQCVLCHSVGTLHTAHSPLLSVNLMAAPPYTTLALVSAPARHLLRPPIG